MNAEPLSEQLARGPYQAYVYAYPHKTAYRPFPEPLPLRQLWSHEPRGSLFLYLHVPFCSMRCGFCNLFTQAKPSEGHVRLYLDALGEQTRRVRDCLPDAYFSRLAIGGGTPTYLSAVELRELFELTRRVMGATAIPIGIEVSPDTISLEKLAVCREYGVQRVSMGVQSFFEQETRNCGRPQSRPLLDEALQLLISQQFPVLNLDLIYGLSGQTVNSWLASLEAALQYSPEELFLYPLYVRPLTGLGRSHKEWDDIRLSCYREGRALLLDRGYEQISMRLFRRAEVRDASGPSYCCQTDGMVGLGCGARSYTRSVHYSLDYAVTPKGVKEIIADYIARPSESFAFAFHGAILDADEQRRRLILQSLFHLQGMSTVEYRHRFGSDAVEDFPEIAAMHSHGCLDFQADTYTPTPLGLEQSDALGPWFFSPAVRQRMAEYELR